MEIPTYFDDFLADIRPDDDQLLEYQDGHKTLRQRMHEDEEISEIWVADFLQGSYRRWTAIKPENGQKSDVDIVVVTTLPDTADTKQVALKFERFLDRHAEYKDKYERKTHSIGIYLDKVEMDLVITSAPSQTMQEALTKETSRTSDVITKAFSPNNFKLSGGENWSFLRNADTGEWRSEPLRIPDFDNDNWGDTDPLTQIAWTSQHNADCNTHYVNVVKALKWWRRTKCSSPKHPKGYPVEHIIGDYCKQGTTSVAKGVVQTLEGIRDCPTLNFHLQVGTVPTFCDRGIPAHNVWKRITFEDFTAFMNQVNSAAIIARDAYETGTVTESARRWHDLFGDPFPCDNDNGGRKGGFELPAKAAQPRHGRFG